MESSQNFIGKDTTAGAPDPSSHDRHPDDNDSCGKLVPTEESHDRQLQHHHHHHPTLIIMAPYGEMKITKYICETYKKNKKVNIKWIILCDDPLQCNFEEIDNVKKHIQTKNHRIQSIEEHWFETKYLILPKNHRFSKQKELFDLCEKDGLILCLLEHNVSYSDTLKQAIYALVNDSSDLHLTISLQKVALVPMLDARKKKMRIQGSIDDTMRNCIKKSNSFRVVEVKLKVSFKIHFQNCAI